MPKPDNALFWTTLGREFCEQAGPVVGEAVGQDAYEIFRDALGVAPDRERLDALSPSDYERLRQSAVNIFETPDAAQIAFETVVAATLAHTDPAG